MTVTADTDYMQNWTQDLKLAPPCQNNTSVSISQNELNPVLAEGKQAKDSLHQVQNGHFFWEAVIGNSS